MVATGATKDYLNQFSGCSIQQYGMSLHNFLKYFPYNRFFFPNFTLSNSYVRSKMLSN
ncbi:hypothetical protein ACJIZ3_000073 [Penstemon smallii]|uniref:Uncharacterized protein n=1 Tax=Penstemon smallii TaxID=265156 RepID=A0ABD3R9F3_9LAMI